MRKHNFSFHFFLYSLLAYLFYIVYFVFIKKTDYYYGLYYFTPSYIFVFIKLFSTGIKKLPSVAIFTIIPFAISVFLNFAFADDPLQPLGWEVSGFMPIAVLASYLFKNAAGSPTPLTIKALPKILKIFTIIILSLTAIHFAKLIYVHNDAIKAANEALLLAVTLWTPAPIAIAATLFINLIISTTATSAILNNINFFNKNAKISRLVFDTDAFLVVPHFNLSGIETVQDCKREDFLAMVEKLNQAAFEDPSYSETLKKSKCYSHSYEDGKTITMGPLHILLANKEFTHKGLALPAKNDDRDFVALAEENRIIGYYAIDKIKASTNSAFLELFDKKYGIKSIIAAPKKPQLWQNIETKESFDEVELNEDDLVISEKHRENLIATEAIWGGNDFSMGDIYIMKPFLTTVLNLMLVSGNIPGKLLKGAFVCSIPFLFQLFATSFGIVRPQISAVALLLSFFMIIIYIFYIKPISKKL